MGRVKIPYYAVIKGRGYWQPKPEMRAKGFTAVSCGPDGPAAWRVASEWNDRWQAARRGAEVAPIQRRSSKATPDTADEAIVYPAGSLGEAFKRFRRSEEWAQKAVRTREDWWRAWKHIRPFFGDLSPSFVSYESISSWRSILEHGVGTREAHRAMKIWRAMWKIAAAMKYCRRDEDPSLGVRNRAAAGRSQTWQEGEVVRLVKAAWREGMHGLAAAIAVMWDTQFSPGDVRALVAGQVARSPDGQMLFTERGKTGVPVGGILSVRTAAVLDAYIAGLGYSLMADAPLFRSRGFKPGPAGGRPRPAASYTKDLLSEDFRTVRALVFGPGEKRQMLDIRRSGAVEAINGGSSAEQLGRAMGNTLGASNALFKTYVPVDITALQDVATSRRRGRAKLRSGNGNGTKV